MKDIKDITVAEFKKRKKELEMILVSICNKEIQAFKEETGITVTNVFFDFNYVQEISKKSGYFLSACIVGTDVDTL